MSQVGLVPTGRDTTRIASTAAVTIDASTFKMMSNGAPFVWPLISLFLRFVEIVSFLLRFLSVSLIIVSLQFECGPKTVFSQRRSVCVHETQDNRHRCKKGISGGGGFKVSLFTFFNVKQFSVLSIIFPE